MSLRLDPDFGWRSACVAHVSGWGGVPLSMQRGPDGRTAVLCLANAYPDAAAAPPNPLTRGLRYTRAPVPSLRIVSLPADGRLTGRRSTFTGSTVEEVFGPPANARI
jgi:hypothetical protein